MDFEMIAAKEIDSYIQDKTAFFIDLRTPEEYRNVHIRGAINIPYEKLTKCMALPADKAIILYCERGSVSLMAAKELARRGYHVKSVAGGIHSYRGAYKESFSRK